MSFNQGLSGLTASSKNLDIIGHNVANANTIGAKSSRGEFADVYAASLGGNGVGEIGFGVRLQAVAQQFSQGSLTPTNNPLDLAIQGLGFFQVQAPNGSTNYTRNGQFKVDKDGRILNNDGAQLVGYKADDNGNILPATGPITVPTAGINPQVTSKISMDYVLDSRETSNTTAINFDDPTTFNRATSVQVFDVQGRPVDMGMYFKKTGTNTWDMYATANGVSLANTAAVAATGTAPAIPAAPARVSQIVFNADGSLATPADGNVTLNIPATTNADNTEKTGAINGVVLNMSAAKQYGESFSVKALSQNGFAPGQLTEVTVDSKGYVMSKYSNGQFKPTGQIELAFFRNPQGLQPLGGNVWGLTSAAGSAVRGSPNSGNFGNLKSSALEESNVDLTKDLVDMMITQRLYQANAQTIKTQDQVLQTLINLR
ncbi:flagellar hook protein FlgE [Amphibiibacter pelophylacis]|uniref:Flagellar hook protein FlgE n=1 Tax=Amphibiibacter pelophylacis TaxID=1799477 RepID=A0ACC6P0R9_9BURK